METKAVIKAGHRLALANRLLDAARNAETYEEFADSWYLFLVASKSVWTILGKGSRISPQSRQWFGRKTKERKSNPLLQYLYQARNDDEHGLDPVTQHWVKVEFPISKPTFEFHKDRGYGMQRIDIPPNIPKISFGVLAPVIGLGDIVFEPPAEQLALVPKEEGAVYIGSILMDYLALLLEEAGERAA